MQWHKLLTEAFLLLLAMIFGLGNLWVTAARSMIPLEFADQVSKKQVRREKHPGKDDVHFLYMESGAAFHVDSSVYDAVAVGETVRKKAWSRNLHHDGKVTQLNWSADFYGMARAMPLIVLVMFVVARVIPMATRRYIPATELTKPSI